MPVPRVAACVVTGFLGSGKTTLLRGLLDREPMRDRIAVIVNEIGEIGVDGRVLGGFEFVENIVELSSGCVCCSIDEYRFDLAIDELVRRLDPLLIVLETTGAADPGPALERLRRCGLGVDAVVTVVDALAWQAAWRTSGAARRQIAAADFLVISKADLVRPAVLAKLRRRLTSSNARALVLQSAGGAPFPGEDLLLATSAARRTTAARPRAHLQPESDGAVHAGGHLGEDAIESFSWQSGHPVDREAFAEVLRSLPPSVLRAKGFLRDPAERVAWLFQLVCGRLEMSAFEGGGAVATGVQAVFIGPGAAADRDGIIARLEACDRRSGLPRHDRG